MIRLSVAVVNNLQISVRLEKGPALNVVSTNPIFASVVKVVPTLTVASASPSFASVIRVIPVTAIAHIDLLLSAAVDTSPRFRFIMELVEPIDTALLTVGKTLSDTVESTEFFIQDISKYLFDAVSIQDVLSRTLAISRTFDDAVVLDELVEKHFVPALRRQWSPWGSSWGSSWGVSWYAVDIDRVGVTDIFAPTLTKNLSDAFALNDSSDVGDGSAYSVTKYINNFVNSGDNLASVLTKRLTDQASATDSGVVSAQSYCNITYFAADYVGTSSTF